MRKVLANHLFERARAYCLEFRPNEAETAASVSPITYRNLKSKKFLSEYCWVVYASGFKADTIEKVFPSLRTAFKDFDINSLGRTRSIRPALAIFNNERKAASFLRGAHLISAEGFSKFKSRLTSEGVDLLEELPGIGPITKYHLAKNIGLIDEAKPDIWLERAAEATSCTVDQLVTHLSKKYQLSRHVVDIIVWRYGADKGLAL